MRILLAGAAGVIGGAMVPLLLQRGHQVTGTTRDERRADRLRDMGAEPVLLDVLDRQAVMEAVDRSRPDVIIHQLTSLSRQDLAANNHLRREGTRNLADAAVSCGVARMIAQSLALYAPGLSPASEGDPLASPETLAGTVAALIELEQCVAGVPQGVVLRYGTMYGRGTWFAPDGMIARQIATGALPVSDGIASFIHVSDAAGAAVQALDWPPGIVNVVDDEPAPDHEWVPWLAQLLRAPAPPDRATRDAPPPPFIRGVSNAKARRELGWQPRYPVWRAGFSEVFADARKVSL
jgi:nucleoside-diphosphate-sugar epimerase